MDSVLNPAIANTAVNSALNPSFNSNFNQRVGNQAARHPHTQRFDSWHMAVIASFISLFLLTFGILGYVFEQNNIIAVGVDSGLINAWQKRIQRQEQQIDRTREQANAQLHVLTKRVAELQAELYQLQGLSLRLAELADVDLQQMMDELQAMTSVSTDSYTSSQLDSYGFGEGEVMMPSDFMETLDSLSAQLSERAGQLMLLEKLLLRRGIADSIIGIGRVVDKGWISSSYGYRTDPFTKKVTMHKGIDISGPLGTSIRSLAPGVVRFSGKKAGYGNMVEIDHGNNFITRYGHNHGNLVAAGDIVNKGQVIAQMGSTGRSTGPHVHFEILRNNENLNPLAYIQASK